MRSKRPGKTCSDPPGLACILNTRIAVEQTASFFKEGWGVTEIERDVSILWEDAADCDGEVLSRCEQ